MCINSRVCLGACLFILTKCFVLRSKAPRRRHQDATAAPVYLTQSCMQSLSLYLVHLVANSLLSRPQTKPQPLNSLWAVVNCRRAVLHAQLAQNAPSAKNFFMSPVRASHKFRVRLLAFRSVPCVKLQSPNCTPLIRRVLLHRPPARSCHLPTKFTI